MQRLVRNAHNNWPKFSQNELDSLCKLCQQCPGFCHQPGWCGASTYVWAADSLLPIL